MMANETAEIEGEVQDDLEQEVTGEQEGETPPDNNGETQDDHSGQDDEVVITIEGVSPPQEEEEAKGAPEWVKNLRKEHRELQRQKRELEQKLAETASANAPGAVKVGEKPTLEACDFDTDLFETELTAWHERKRQADAQAAQQRKETEAAQAAWAARVNDYQAAKTALKVPDFVDAEEVVLGTLNQTQQGIIITGADDPAKLMYAIGKSPAKAKELAAIKDPVKYAFAVAKLETQLKVTPRKAAPAPERQVRGSTGGGTGMDNQLDKLRAEADRTGDRSKVVKYLAEQQRRA